MSTSPPWSHDSSSAQVKWAQTHQDLVTLQKAALQDDVIPHPNWYLWNAPQIVENKELSRDGSQGRSIVKCLSVYIHFPQPRPMFSSKAAQLFPYIQTATHFTHARMEGRGRLFHKLKLAFPCNTRGHNKVRQSSGSSPSDTEIHIPLTEASASCTTRPRRYWHTITITSTDFSLRKRRILKTEIRFHFKNWNAACAHGDDVVHSWGVQECARACAQRPKVSSKSLVITPHPPHWGKVSLATWLPI